MRYIRTKDGIYRVLQCGAKIKHYVCVFDNKTLGHKEYDTSNVIKQADTIDELCDGFIVELPMRHYHFYFEKERNNIAFKTAIDEYNKWRGTRSDMSIEGKGSKELVYLWAVIWVKGANGQPIPKVVAKLNGEGDLELL